MDADFKPAMTLTEVAAYVKFASNAEIAVEFGCGGSTLAAARSRVKHMYSVESDQRWIARCLDQPDIEIASTAGRLEFIHADIGETGEYGYPIDKTSFEKWPSYHSAIWASIAPPDFVFVDGRFRVACATQAAAHCLPGAMIAIHDYSFRPEYHVVESVLGRPRIIDSMAIFERPLKINISTLASVLSEHFLTLI
jgi:hypothetical protein